MGVRVTRNYGNHLVNGKGNNRVSKSKLGRKPSLLQQALARTNKGRRTTRMDSLNLKRANALTGSSLSGDSAQRLYYNMKYHAGQVEEYAQKLTDKGSNSLFAKAKEKGDTSEVEAAIKGLVGQYNSMMEGLRESGTRADLNYRMQIDRLVGQNSSEMAAAGVTRLADGTLKVDDAKLAAAGVETLQKLWGNGGSLSGNLAMWADSVEKSAEQNMRAESGNMYSSLLKNYGNSGNYFNFWS